MPVELALGIVVPIVRRKYDVSKCSCSRAVKLFVHGRRW